MTMVLRSLATNPTEDEVLEVMGSADQDGDLELDFSEFVRVLVQRSTGAKVLLTQIHEFREAYAVFNMKKDGSVSDGSVSEREHRLDWEAVEYGMVRLGLMPRSYTDPYRIGIYTDPYM